jgi:hypothetical protein
VSPDPAKLVEVKDAKALQSELDKAGADGWELVSTNFTHDKHGLNYWYALFFKRPCD